jgi:hypothetical protein
MRTTGGMHAFGVPLDWAVLPRPAMQTFKIFAGREDFLGATGSLLPVEAPHPF